LFLKRKKIKSGPINFNDFVPGGSIQIYDADKGSFLDNDRSVIVYYEWYEKENNPPYNKNNI